jgi:hydrogenase expression/formation protein HypC
MCLAIPGRIVELTEEEGMMRMGRVDFGGVVRDICLTYLPDAGVGDYVIVHTGFAISQVDEEEAQETLRLLTELAGFQEEIETSAEG